MSNKFFLVNGKRTLAYKRRRCGLHPDTRGLGQITNECNGVIQGPNALRGKATVLRRRDEENVIIQNFTGLEIYICPNCFEASR